MISKTRKRVKKLVLPTFSLAAPKNWVAQNLGGLQPPPPPPPGPYAYAFMTQRLLFGICMLCNRPLAQVNRKKAVSRNEASPCILCKIVHTPLQRNARKVCWPKCLHPHYQRSPIGLFSPIIFTQISAQSRNLDPNFRLIPSSQPKFPLNPVILMVILRIPHPVHTFIPESRPILL